VLGGTSLDWYDYGARMYDPIIGRWHVMDILAEKTISYSPYVYVRNNPLLFIDPLGLKDTTYNASTDKPVNDQPGTKTPVYLTNPDGSYQLDENGKPIYDPNAKDAYNCHSYAWENSQGDPTDRRNDPNLPRWDENPDNNMGGYTQLGNNDPNKPGDRVIYFTDANSNGSYDKGENISHSAIVKTVDKNGNTTTVVGKRGQLGISENHPRAPGYYNTDINKNTTSRAYYRSTSATNVQSSQISRSSFAPNTGYIPAARNATYVAPPAIIPINPRK